MNDVDFNAAASFDRALFCADGGSVRHLVVRVKATRNDGPRPADRAPLNIALVIDASGSMAGGKLEAAKAAAIGLAERLTARDRLTVVSFASDVLVHLDAVPVAADNAPRIRSQIAGLETRGMTCLSGGWFAGVEHAARIAEKDPRMKPRVIILSDGHANEGIVDPEALREHAGELRLRGVLTSCLGIGDDYDEQLLQAIAESGGGRLHDAELTSEISSVLLGELDDIFGAVVEDATIELAVPPGVRVETLGRTGVAVHGDRLIVALGAIQDAFERVVVFRVTCPEARTGDALAFGLTARGRAVDDFSALATDLTPIMLRAADARVNGAQPRDAEIAAIVARTWSAHVVTTAARMNRDGVGEEAERHIKRELCHFRRYAEGLDCGPALVAQLELLAHRAGRRLSPRMRKEMVVQSALLMESRVDHRGVDKAAWSVRLARDHR